MKSKKKPELGSDLKEGVIPKPKMITTESLKKCGHSVEHHPNGECNSCGCTKYNGCGE